MYIKILNILWTVWQTTSGYEKRWLILLVFFHIGQNFLQSFVADSITLYYPDIGRQYFEAFFVDGRTKTPLQYIQNLKNTL